MKVRKLKQTRTLSYTEWMLFYRFFDTVMPAIRLFGRKWLAASDDLVIPGLFEISFRLLWYKWNTETNIWCLELISTFPLISRLILIACVHIKYYDDTWKCSKGGDYVRVYIIGMMALLALVILVLIALVNQSAKGSITNVESRKYVPPILLVKLFLIIPEIVLNVFGTLWAFCKDLVVCPYEGDFSRAVIEGIFTIYTRIIE